MMISFLFYTLFYTLYYIDIFNFILSKSKNRKNMKKIDL